MLRIATVDDNSADLKEIRMCLSHYFQKRAGQTPIDYTISAYTSGPSFLENFEKGDYDLILLDIYMPRMTGMQVAEEIRAIDDEAWIIFLTTSRDHALESYNVFASGYVLKPLLENAPQLETLLTRLLPEDALAAKTPHRKARRRRMPLRPLQPHPLHGLSGQPRRHPPPRRPHPCLAEQLP